VYQREFLPGRGSTITRAWRVLVVMLIGFIAAIIVSLALMFNKSNRDYNVITTLWEGACFAITFVVVSVATYRLKAAANQRRQSLARRVSGSQADPGNPMTPLLRKVFVICLVLILCFLASLAGAYSVFVDGAPFGGTPEVLHSTPPNVYIYWDYLLLDIMYVIIHTVITILGWKSPRQKRSVEDSDKKSMAWERKSSGSSKPRVPLSPLSLNSQHSQEGVSNNGSPEEIPPLSPDYSREHSNSDYALSG